MTLTAASPVNIGSSRYVRSGKMPANGLKIRWPKGRAGSTPAPGTNHFNNLQTAIVNAIAALSPCWSTEHSAPLIEPQRFDTDASQFSYLANL